MASVPLGGNEELPEAFWGKRVRSEALGKTLPFFAASPLGRKPNIGERKMIDENALRSQVLAGPREQEEAAARKYCGSRPPVLHRTRSPDKQKFSRPCHESRNCSAQCGLGPSFRWVPGGVVGTQPAGCLWHRGQRHALP